MGSCATCGREASEVAMSIFDRNKGVPGAKPNLWLRYSITEALRVQHGLPARQVREPAGVGDQRAARAVLAQRKREAKDGSWVPLSASKARGMTVAQYVAKWTTERKTSGVRTADDEEQRLRDYVLPTLGARGLNEIKRRDVAALFVLVQSVPSSRTKKKLAPRTVHRVYEALRTMYQSAVFEELVEASPCTLRVARGELPGKKDPDPRWRSTAVFTRHEIESLISDDRLPLRRRVLYALIFFAGLRHGEAVGRRWRDYDSEARPLGRLLVASQYNDQPLKTEKPREIPVHPVLATMLDAWRREGFPMLYQRHPKPDDFLVPKLRGRGAQTMQRTWDNLQTDLDTLGLRPRRVHDLRRTFVTLARADGARSDILRWISHGPTSDMTDLYTSPPWALLCEQVEVLRVGLPKAKVIELKRKAQRGTHDE